MLPTKALELSNDELEQLVKSAMDRITGYLAGIEDHPVDTSNAVDQGYIRSLVEPAPEKGTAVESLLELLFERGAGESLNPTSPGFMGYVPGGGLIHAGVADLIASTLNRYVGVATVAPVLAQIEANVIRWFCEIVGYPKSARGFLTSGGSLASMSAIITARHTQLGESFSRGVIYVSDQVHHCVNKAAILAGFPRANVRVLEADASFRLDPQDVLAAIREDRARGLTPFLLAASAGTTNTGAVDPLPALAAMAKKEKLWFHVDAAYGGFFCMTDRGKQILQGISQADSIVLDPHKTLFLPYGTGALLVQNGNHLKATHSSVAAYMPPMQQEDAFVDFCELSPELTRPFRGLRVWLPIKMHGLSVFRAYLDEKLDLARWIQLRLEEISALRILAPAELSILAFAITDASADNSVDVLNLMTKELLQRINKKNRIHLTGTTVKGVFAIRIAISSFRTHQDRMQMLLDDILESLSEMDY